MMIFFLATTVGSISWWLTGWLASPGSPIVSLDHPNEQSLHRTPTPRSGGIAIMGALYVGVLMFGVVSWIRSSLDESTPVFDSTGWWILKMTGVISIVSLMDDRRGLPIAVRFGVQLLAATFLVIGSGWALPPTAVPMLGLIKLGWLTAPLTVLFFVWMANLYNFMDGMDGFAGGMTVIGCGLLGYLGWQPPFSQVPLWAMSLGGQCGYILQVLLRKLMPLSSATLEKLIGDMSFQPRWAFEAAVPEIIQHYRRSLS